MKKKIFSIVLILALVFSSFVYATESAMPISENTVSVETESETVQQEYTTITESYAMFDENANLQNTLVDGNIFAFGVNVNLSSVVVYGDIFIAGQNITLSDVTVYGTAFLASEVINMNNANFAGNIFNASQTMNFKGVAQDVFAVAENIGINEESMIAREMFATAQRIVLSGNIGKNAHLAVDELIVEKTANIEGVLKYSSENEAGISNESTIGAVEFEQIEETQENTNSNVVATSAQFGVKAYNVLALAIKSIFVCGFIFLFAKGFMERQKTENVVAYIGKNALKGLGWAIIIPVIGILLLCTGICFGLSVTVFALYSIVLWAGVPIVAIAITSNIKQKGEYNVWKVYGQSILISLIIAIVKQIPVVGGIITFIVSIAAMGIVISALKNKKENIEKVETEVIE